MAFFIILKGNWFHLNPYSIANLFFHKFDCFLFFFSDLDLVLIGKWEEPPFRTLEQALLQRQIAKADSTKVLDKAAVSI